MKRLPLDYQAHNTMSIKLFNRLYHGYELTVLKYLSMKAKQLNVFTPIITGPTAFLFQLQNK